MDEPIDFKELKFPGTNLFIHTFDYDYLPIYNDTRIYYKLKNYGDYGDGKRKGFDFYITEFYSCIVSYKKMADIYKTKGFKASCLFWGNVNWDGLRHLYMGDIQTDNENYLYYVNTDILCKVFVKLKELEKRYCCIDYLDDL